MHKPLFTQDMQLDAFEGLGGEIALLIGQHTEADPTAVLLQLLTGFGNAVGREAYVEVGADRHHPNLFVCIVGPTGTGRKGLSYSEAIRPLRIAVPVWYRTCITTGLSSGEGLIHHVRDRQGSDKGVKDKRRLFRETEFSSALRRMRREGNPLSGVLRDAWDGISPLSVVTKHFPDKATDALISIVGHITPEELRRELTDVDAASGFANRFLFSWAQRTRPIAEGGSVTDDDLKPYASKLRRGLKKAQGRGAMRRDGEARDLWGEVYPDLAADRPGFVGKVTGRAEPQITRLALIYALLDGAAVIRAPHLKAALAVRDYCEQTAGFLFGELTGDNHADRIVAALRGAGSKGLTRKEVRDLFSQHVTKAEIAEARDLLLGMGLIEVSTEPTRGRPRERWVCT